MITEISRMSSDGACAIAAPNDPTVTNTTEIVLYVIPAQRLAFLKQRDVLDVSPPPGFLWRRQHRRDVDRPFPSPSSR